MSLKSELVERIVNLYNSTCDFENLKHDVETLLQDYLVTKDEVSGRSNLKKRIVHFLNAKKIDGLASRTIGNYCLTLGLFSNQISKHVAKISTDDIRDYIAYLTAERHLKESSLQTHINTLRTFFSWLHIEGIIKKNPMLKIKSLKLDKKGARHALSVEELERLRNACRSYKEKALIEFFVSSGCRLSEVANIKMEDINFRERSVKVKGKGRKERTVYFSIKASIMIEEYVKRRKGGAALFASSKAPYTPMGNRAIQQAIGKIGLCSKLLTKIYPHLLRHTFATHSLNSGLDITIIQRLLGHEDIGTTQIYAVISQTYIRTEYEKLVA